MYRVVHFEIAADDTARAKKFYTDVFGWKMEDWKGEGMEYTMVMTGDPKEPGGINGGMYKREGKITTGAENAFVCTIDIANIDEMMEKVKAAGGQVLMPKSEIPSVGWFTKCKDTEGNLFGLMQSTMKS